MHAIAYGTWEAFGVQMCTTSMSLAATSSMSANAVSAPQDAATSWDRSGEEAITPTTSAPASSAARRWTVPIMPVPRMATRRRAEEPVMGSD